MAVKSSKQGWREMDPKVRLRIVLASIIQVSLLIAALVDIRRRPAADIRGSKVMWTAIAFVNFVGPIAYFLLGRRRQLQLPG